MTAAKRCLDCECEFPATAEYFPLRQDKSASGTTYRRLGPYCRPCQNARIRKSRAKSRARTRGNGTARRALSSREAAPAPVEADASEALPVPMFSPGPGTDAVDDLGLPMVEGCGRFWFAVPVPVAYAEMYPQLSDEPVATFLARFFRWVVQTYPDGVADLLRGAAP